MQSLTDATRCNHRTPPIPDCHKCLCRELVAVLEKITARWAYLARCPDPACGTCGENWEIGEMARTVLEKAKLMDCEEKS